MSEMVIKWISYSDVWNCSLHHWLCFTAAFYFLLWNVNKSSQLLNHPTWHRGSGAHYWCGKLELGEEAITFSKHTSIPSVQMMFKWALEAFNAIMAKSVDTGLLLWNHCVSNILSMQKLKLCELFTLNVFNVFFLHDRNKNMHIFALHRLTYLSPRKIKAWEAFWGRDVHNK